MGETNIEDQDSSAWKWAKYIIIPLLVALIEYAGAIQGGQIFLAQKNLVDYNLSMEGLKVILTEPPASPQLVYDTQIKKQSDSLITEVVKLKLRIDSLYKVKQDSNEVIIAEGEGDFFYGDCYVPIPETHFISKPLMPTNQIFYDSVSTIYIVVTDIIGEKANLFIGHKKMNPGETHLKVEEGFWREYLICDNKYNVQIGSFKSFGSDGTGTYNVTLVKL